MQDASSVWTQRSPSSELWVLEAGMYNRDDGTCQLVLAYEYLLLYALGVAFVGAQYDVVQKFFHYWQSGKQQALQ